MDQAERDHIQHELEIAANELFARLDTPGRVAATRRRTDGSSRAS